MNGPAVNVTYETVSRTVHVRRGGARWPESSSCTSDAKGKFRFRQKASNGEIIAVGEAYESKASAKKGIESVQKNAARRHVLI